MIRKLYFLLALTLSGCASVSVRVIDPASIDNDGNPVVVKAATVDAPGGDSFSLVVYWGKNQNITAHAGGDSTALVQATATVAEKAVSTALTIAK